MLEDLLIPGSPLHCPHLSFPLPGIFLHPFLPACHHQLAQPKAGAPVPGWQGGEEPLSLDKWSIARWDLPETQRHSNKQSGAGSAAKPCFFMSHEQKMLR